MKRYLILAILVLLAIALRAQSITKLCDHKVFDFYFSPAGALVYLTNGKCVDVWDIQSKSLVRNLNQGADSTIISIDVSKDSTLLVSSSLDSVISIWNLIDFTLVKKTRISNVANTVLFNNSGHNVIAGLRNGDILAMNPVSNNVLLRKETGLDEVTSLAIDSTGDFLAISGSDGTLQLWNLDSLIMIDQEKTKSGYVRDIKFSSNGQQLYACSDDGKVTGYILDINKFGNISYVNKNSFRKPWIMSMDLWNQKIAIADIRGRVILETKNVQYSYHVSDEIFKLRFLPQNKDYFILGVATSNGFKFISQKSPRVRRTWWSNKKIRNG